MPDAGSVAAKIAWLAAHDRDRLEASAWVLAPRDLVAWWLTGAVATDATMASRSGLYDGDDVVVEELAGTAATKVVPRPGVGPGDRSGQPGGRPGRSAWWAAPRW